MKNFVQPGESVEFTAPAGGVTSGVGVQIGQLFVIATVTAAEGARFNGLIEGVVTHTKPGSQAWAEGAVIYWDQAASKMTTVSAGNLQIGVATVAVGSGAGETTGTVRLDGVGRPHDGT
jgi:predicted RecA/RadA family phage recombinase